MENDQEIDKIIMNIKQGTGSVTSLVYMKAQCVMLLLQFLYRMYKERLIKPHEFKNMQEFVKATNGRFNIMNVPEMKIMSKASLKSELDNAGVRYYIFPDLNRKDGVYQVAVFSEDQGKFNAIYNRNLMQNMQGGMKSMEELQAVTEGNTSIVSVPMEDKKDVIKNDFDALKVNYAILPDLKVGDGEVQVVVANVDLPKVQHWFELYKNDQLAQGNEVKDMSIINQEQYASTGKMTEEEYINTGDEKVKAANAKYEGREKGVIEKNAINSEKKIRTISDVAYDELYNNPDYHEITINAGTLVGNSMYAGDIMSRLPDAFASRIPGTYGKEEELTLILPKKNVFSTDGGQTYIAFLKKDEKPMVYRGGKPLPMEDRWTGESLYEIYAEVTRKFQNGKKQALQEDKTAEVIKSAESLSADKIPSVPVKVK